MVPWANGLGTTAVIARVPDSDEWVWRVSIADVVSDGPFSSLPGVDRWIAVAAGPGMVLTVDGVETALTASSGAFAFDGGATTSCRLIDGPIQDLNLMVRRGRASGSMEIVSLVPADPPLPLHDVAAVVVLDGEIHLDGEILGAGDAVLAPKGAAVGAATVARICVDRSDPE